MRNGQADGVGYGYGHLNQAKVSSADYSDAEFPTLQPSRIDNGWIKVAKSETKKISSKSNKRNVSLKVAAELEKKQRKALMVSEWSGGWKVMPERIRISGSQQDAQEN